MLLRLADGDFDSGAQGTRGSGNPDGHATEREAQVQTQRGGVLSVTCKYLNPIKKCVTLKSEPSGQEVGQAVWEMLEKGFLLGLCSNPAPPYTLQPKASYLTSLNRRCLSCKCLRMCSVSTVVCKGL